MPSRASSKKSPGLSGLKVLAAQTLKIASINGLGELDKLENDLEEEINFENGSQAKTVIGRLRREGHHHLHNKIVLFIVVILNIIDCLLVMGELTLDFHHVSHLLTNKKAMVDSFADELEDKYSPHLDEIVNEERHVLLQSVLDSTIIWPHSILNSAADNVTLAASQCYSYVTSAARFSGQNFEAYVASLPVSNWSTAQPLSSCFQPLVGIFTAANGQSSSEEVGKQEYKLTNLDHPNEKLILVAHKLHYISVAILSVLVVILILKIVCAGRRFLKSKMAVFDGIVVVISFTLDIVFIKGIHIFNTNDFVIILTFLLPWRIIRVLNSLIAAVLDKQRLNLKIIYTQKKKITRNLTEVNNKVDVMQRQIQILQGLCSSRGIADGDVRKILGTEKPEKHDKTDSKKHHSGGGLASMMALGKLAFQAADALAPMPSYSGKSTPTSPTSTPNFNNKYPTTSTTPHSTASATTTNSATATATAATTNVTATPSSAATTNGVAHAPSANGSVPTGDGSNTSNNKNNYNNNSSIVENGESPDSAAINHNEEPGATGSNPPAGTARSFQAGTQSNSRNDDHRVEDSISENLELPEISQSASLDNESAATISMDLRDDDDDDDDYDITSASIDDVSVDLKIENELEPKPSAAMDRKYVSDMDATSKL